MVMQEHNWWTNFPTWAVFTYLTVSPTRLAMARNIANSPKKGIERDDDLRLWVETHNPLYGKDYNDVGVFRQLLLWGLNNVNWTEIEKALEED